MVIILNGPLGIGKTATSWALLARFERAVLLEGDYLSALQPFDYYNQAHLDYAYATIGLVAAHHVAHGIRVVIINWVLESPEQLARLKQAVAPLALPTLSYRLWCDPAVIAERIRGRNAAEVAWELQRAQDLVAILDAAAQSGDLGIVVDTTSLSIEQTAEVIWQQVQRQTAP